MKKRRLRKRRNIIVALVAICAVALIAEVALLVVFLNKNRGKNDSREEPTGLPKFETYGIQDGRKISIRAEWLTIGGNSTRLYVYSYDEEGRLLEKNSDLSYNEDESYEYEMLKGILQLHYIITDADQRYIFTDTNGVYVEMPSCYSRNLFSLEGEKGDTVKLTMNYDTSMQHGEKTILMRREVTWEYAKGQIAKRTQIRCSMDELSKEQFTEKESEIEYVSYDESGRVLEYHEKAGKCPYTMKYSYEGDYRTEIYQDNEVTETSIYYGDYRVSFTRQTGDAVKKQMNYRINGNLPESAGIENFAGYFLAESKGDGRKDTVTKIELRPDGQPAKSYNTDGSFSREFSYDENGMCSKITERRENGNVESKVVRELKFDEYGDLTECRIVYDDDENTEAVYSYVWNVPEPITLEGED